MVVLEIYTITQVFTEHKFIDLITIHLREIKIRFCVAHYQTESYNYCTVAERTQLLGYIIFMDLNQISTIKDYLYLWKIM